jgi:hypothetical protein
MWRTVQVIAVFLLAVLALMAIQRASQRAHQRPLSVVR